MNKKYPYSLLKKSILNKFEIKGGWVTDSKDINVVDKYKYGTLKYTSNDINLTLFQGFPSKDEKKMCFNEEPQRYPDIYGRIADMTSYYIHAVNNSELSIPVFADLLPVHTQKINVSYFTVSNYFPVKSVRMKTLIIGSTFLNEWLKPLQKMRPFDEDDSFGIRIYKSESQLLGNFNYNNQKFEIFFTGNVNQDAIARGRQINIINDSFLRIASKEEITAEKALEIDSKLNRLFTIICSSPVSSSLISLRGEKSYISDVYCPSNYPINENNTNAIFEGKDFELGRLFSNWFSMSDELKLLTDNYAITVSYSETIENKLINLIESIESFYRKNNITLFQAMKRLIHSLPSEILYKITEYVGSIDEWLKKLRNTRVFLTHGTERKARFTDINELIVQVNIFQILIQCFIMKELGYDFKKNHCRKIVHKIDMIFNTSFL